MNPPTYTQRRASLARQWASMRVTRNQGEITRQAQLVVAHRTTYQRAEAATGVPWWVVGVIDLREAGAGHLTQRHLHNGDLLTGYTHQVPAGRPQVGHGPPFTWLESAVDALRLKNFHRITSWPVERVLHELEPYNGWGYYYRGLPSPYIWSCTSVYDPPAGPGGKFVADHVFDSHVVDQQVGCAPLLAAIARLEPSVRLFSDPGGTPTKNVAGGSIVAAGAGAAAAASQFGWGWGSAAWVLGGAAVLAALVWLFMHWKEK